MGVVAVFLTYAVNNRDSFGNLDLWLAEAKEKANEGAIVILVGNKSDLERKVSYEEGLQYMKSHNLDVFFETSAKNGENVNKVALFYVGLRGGRQQDHPEGKAVQEG